MHSSLHGRACRKGVVTLPVQMASYIDVKLVKLVKLMVIILSQRALAVVSSKKKAMSSASPVASALTGSGTATQTELPRKQPSRSQAAACAQVFFQCLRAAVSTAVGGVARQRNYSA